METKRDIRKQMLCARDRLTDREWETYSDRITEQVVSHPLFVQAKEIWMLCIYGKRSVYRTNSGKCVESGKKNRSA